jgi:hypothetical protein
MCTSDGSAGRRRREERFHEELRHLLDDEPAHPKPPEPMVQTGGNEGPRDREVTGVGPATFRPRAECATR